MLALNKNNLNIVDCASKEDSRYVLQSIRIDKDKTTVTDGRVLVEVSAPVIDQEAIPEIPGLKKSKEEIKSFLLPAEACKQLSKAVPKTKLPILNYIFIDSETTNSNGFALLGSTDLSKWPVYNIKKVEGEYPDTEVVWPKDGVLDRKITITFNPEYLIKVLRHAKAVNPGKVVLKFYGDEKAVRIEAKNEEQNLRALVLPLTK